MLNARTHQRASFSGNKQARCGVHAKHFSNERAFLSTSHVHTAGRSVCSYTHKRARLSPTARAGLDRSRHLGPPASPISSDCMWTNVKPRWRSGRHSTCPQAATIVVGGIVPVTLLGECALSRGTRSLTLIIKNIFI